MYQHIAVSIALVAGLAACTSTTSKASTGERLTLVRPADQTVRRGETNKVSVWVRRANFEAPVDLKVEDLPKGLEVVERDPRVLAGNDIVELTLYAKPDADLVTGHAVKITATAANELSAIEWFHVDVKPQ